MTGLLVAIDGPKFVGKTTLMNQLRVELGAAASTWIFTKEPTEQFDLGNEQRFVGKDLAALIAADRAHHLTDVIEPALEAGRVVVTDRYVLSSYVFHCLDGVSTSVIADLNTSFRPPDVLVILQCSPGTLLARRVQHGRATRLSNALSVVTGHVV